MNRLTGPLLVLTLLAILLGTALLARAQETVEGPPPGSLSLSEILRKVEGRPDFGFVQQITWQQGSYRIAYRTKDGTLRQMAADALTGMPHPARMPPDKVEGVPAQK